MWVVVSQINRNIIIGIGIVVSFALLVISGSFYFNLQHDVRAESRLDPDTIEKMSTEEIKAFLEQRRSNQNTFHSFYFTHIPRI